MVVKGVVVRRWSTVEGDEEAEVEGLELEVWGVCTVSSAGAGVVEEGGDSVKRHCLGVVAMPSKGDDLVEDARGVRG